MTTAKYDPQADRWTENAYADAATYLSRRARLVAELGPRLEPGETVLDLACGDGGLGTHLLALGYRYHGVDASEAMAEAARARLGDRAEVTRADLNDFEPPAPVAAATIFRAVYYARDRQELFRRIAAYTERKLVFDLNPRQYPVTEVVADLREAGFARIELRPFFSPQTVSLPRPLVAALAGAERAGPLARLALRFRFTYVVAAAR